MSQSEYQKGYKAGYAAGCEAAAQAHHGLEAEMRLAALDEAISICADEARHQLALGRDGEFSTRQRRIGIGEVKQRLLHAKALCSAGLSGLAPEEADA